MIDTNGVISWTPSEAQGPSTNTITTVVSDGLASVTNEFVVTVLEVNVAPTLEPISDRVVHSGTSLHVQCNGSDPDFPANNLTYVLLTAPTGAAIEADTGLISWTTTDADIETTNVFQVQLSDDGEPNMHTMGAFQVVVAAPPLFQSIEREGDQVRLTWTALPDYTYQLQGLVSPGSTNWFDLASPVTASGSTASQTNSILDAPLKLYRVKLLP